MKLAKLLFILLIVSVYFSSTGTAQPVYSPVQQDKVPRITGYLEILGNSGFYSVNSDITFPSSYGFRLGLMPFTILDDDRIITDEINNVLLLLMPYRLIGTGSNRLEVGAGVLLGEVESSWDYIKPPGITATIGYRKHPTSERPFLFRIGLTPVFSESNIFLRAGISFGWLINGR